MYFIYCIFIYWIAFGLFSSSSNLRTIYYEFSSNLIPFLRCTSDAWPLHCQRSIQSGENKWRPHKWTFKTNPGSEIFKQSPNYAKQIEEWYNNSTRFTNEWFWSSRFENINYKKSLFYKKLKFPGKFGNATEEKTNELLKNEPFLL